MKHDIDWLVQTLERGSLMLKDMRKSSSHAQSNAIRAIACQIDAAKIMAKFIQKGESLEPTKSN